MDALMQVLETLTPLTVVTFVVASMLAMGLGEKLRDVVAPLQDRRATLLALVVNFAFAPLLAWSLTRLIPLEPAHATGLLLLGGAAGAPFLPKLAERAGGSLAQAIALMVLLMVGTVFFVPLVMPWIVPGLEANPLRIAAPLVLLMLVPLRIGFALGARGGDWVPRLLRVVRTVSNVAFVLLIALLIVTQFQQMVATLGSFAIATYVLFVLLLFIGAYLLSSGDQPTRTVFALGAGQRNISAALVVAGASFGDPAIIVMVLLGAIVGLLVLLGLATAFRSTGLGVRAPE